MKKPLEVDCPKCLADAGNDCQEWHTNLGGMITVPGLIHPERVAFAAYKSEGDEGDAPSVAAFDNAVLKSGLI